MQKLACFFLLIQVCLVSDSLFVLSKELPVEVELSLQEGTFGVPFSGDAEIIPASFVIHGSNYDVVLIQVDYTFTHPGLFCIVVADAQNAILYKNTMICSEDTGNSINLILRNETLCQSEASYFISCSYQSESQGVATLTSINVQAYRQQSSSLYPLLPKKVKPFMLGPWGKADSRADTPGGSEKLIELHVITIGALLDLSGPLSSFGLASKAVLETAIEEFNKSFENQPDDKPFFEAQALVYDTKLNPDLALQYLQELYDMGIRFVIGPNSSSEMLAMKEFADTHGMLLISPSSTAPDLAIPDDNLFRFTVDDRHQGVAVAESMSQLGIQAVVSVYRDDNYGRLLIDAVKKQFEKLGGNCLPAIFYSVDQTGFSNEINRLNEAVEKAIDLYGENAVAVHVVAFEEILHLIRQASTHPNLLKVRWFGGDGQPQDKKIVEDPIVAEFVYRTCFTGYVYGGVINTSVESDRIVQQAQQQGNVLIGTQALTLYDIFHVLIKAIQQADYATSAAPIRREIIRVAQNYYGITGAAALNEAGDRQIGNFDIWNVGKLQDGGYQWERTGIFIETVGEFPNIITYKGCPCIIDTAIGNYSIH